MLRFNPSRILLTTLLILAAPALQADPAGTVEFIKGRVIAIGADHKMRPVAAEDEIGEGQIIVTGREGELHVRMVDGAMIAVRPNSRLKIDRYRAQGGDEDGAFFELLKGAMRSVTGWIGRTQKDRYRIKTATATIGVRGTDHETAVIERNQAARKLFGEPGTYDKVNDGSTVMQNKKGTLVLQKHQAGFVGFGNQAPKKLNKVPDFFKPGANEQRFNRRKMDLREQLNNGNPPQPLRPGAGGGPHSPAPKSSGPGAGPHAPAPQTRDAGGGPHIPAPPDVGRNRVPAKPEQKPAPPSLNRAPAGPAKQTVPAAPALKIEPPPSGGASTLQKAPATRAPIPKADKVEPPPPSMNKHDLTTRPLSGGRADRLPAVQMKANEKMKKDDSGLKLQQLQREPAKQLDTPINKRPAVQSGPALQKSAGEFKVR